MTALNIESYKDLKQDPADVTATLLVLVAQSVNSFVIKDNMINSTFSLPLTPEPFEPSRASVVINALWFTSLVLSLTTASFAILVKQWLKEFPPSDWMSPREHLEERLRRYDGFMKWHVLDIANALPLVLQLSLALFFVGLGEFLRQLHPFIGWWISALTYIWFASFTFVTLAPLRFSYCPYRTPVISIRRVLGKENFCQWISSIARVLRNAGRRLARGRRPQGEDIEMMAADNDSRAAVVPVVEQAREEPKSLVDSKHAKSGLEILKRVDAFFFDDDLLSAMRVCLTGSEFDLNTILEWIPEVVANRYGGRKPQTLDDRTLSSLAMDGLKPVVAIIVESMARDVGGRTPDDWAPFDIELPVSIRTALILVIRWVHLMPDCVSIFGGILNILLQLNADVTKDLVGNVLSRNWFVPRDSYFWITDAKSKCILVLGEQCPQSHFSGKIHQVHDTERPCQRTYRRCSLRVPQPDFPHRPRSSTGRRGRGRRSGQVADGSFTTVEGRGYGPVSS